MMLNIKDQIMYILIKVLNLKKNVKLKRNIKVNFSCKFEGKNVINEKVRLYNSEIGLGTYIGKECEIINCKIGRFSCIGPETKIILGTHPINKYVSIHPAFYSIQKQSGFTFVKNQLFNEYKNVKDTNFNVIIGNDVWIGQGVKILQGVSIGDGAIIGAGAVVTHDIEEYTINVGIPAKKIKYRFKKNEIDFLKELQWWDKGFEWIEKNHSNFIDIEKMININKREFK